MFEAEIKYVAPSSFVLPGPTPATALVYEDRYIDTPDGSLTASGRELRLRTINGHTTLTFKTPPFDAATDSKEERETEVADGSAMEALLAALGFGRRMAYRKTCRLHQATFRGTALTITVVTVDFDPRTFVEIEHLAATRQAGLDVLPVIRDYAAHCGLLEECRTPYTSLFMANQAHAAATGRDGR